MDKIPILFDLPEVIETSRLLLHIPKAGWGGRLHEAMLDGYKDYVYWLSWPPNPPSVEAVEEECRRKHAAFIVKELIRYLIIDKETNRVLGRCGFSPLHTVWAIPQFGISYFMRETVRGKGYATEAAHALTRLAFQKLRAKKFEIHCDAENIASSKIPQKLGFVLECAQKGGWPRIDNQLADIMIYSIFSEGSLPKWPVKWE